MRMIVIIITLSSTLGFSNTEFDRSRIKKLKTMDDKYLVKNSELYTINLTSGVCEDLVGKSGKMDLDSIQKSVASIAPQIHNVVELFSKTIDKVESMRFERLKESVFPIEISLSIDSTKECINGVYFEDGGVFIPAPVDNSMEGVILEILKHELGHLYQHHVFEFGDHNNLLQEAFADSFALLMNGAKVPHIGLHKEVYGIDNVERSPFPWMKSYGCTSRDSVRDFTVQTPTSAVYRSGGDLYITSCFINSKLYSISKNVQEFEVNLLAFIKSYVQGDYINSGGEFVTRLSEIYGVDKMPLVNFQAAKLPFELVTDIDSEGSIEFILNIPDGTPRSKIEKRRIVSYRINDNDVFFTHGLALEADEAEMDYWFSRSEKNESLFCIHGDEKLILTFYSAYRGLGDRVEKSSVAIELPSGCYQP